MNNENIRDVQDMPAILTDMNSVTVTNENNRKLNEAGYKVAENGTLVSCVTPLDVKYMKQALTQARKAEKLMEVPIGCVIVHEGKVIGRGYNRRNTDKTTLGHAEITAIRKASRVIGDWRLEECTLYVTLEPCQMCAGAIVQARIPRVVIGSMNPKAGCAGSILNLLDMPQFNHRAEVLRGVLEEECSSMLTSFFKRLREEKKNNNRNEVCDSLDKIKGKEIAEQ